MRKVSIRTAQNIAIDFTPASLGERFLAFALDMLFLGVGSFVLLIVLGNIHEYLIYLIVIFIVLYTVISEIWMNGYTLGKKAMGLRVVNVYGEEPATLDFIIRWAFRLVDIWFSLGSLAVIFISTGRRSQRLGGVLSNTMVIKLAQSQDMVLRDILTIDDRSKYDPVFTDVHRFNEEDMLTIKAVIDRYRKFGNSAHAGLVQLTAERCAKVLELDKVPENKTDFLRTLLRDYIVTTRS